MTDLPPQVPPVASYYPAAAAAPAYDRDADHLRLLATFHYVWGGLTLAFSSLFILHVIMGALIVSGRLSSPPAAAAGGPGFPREAGYLFMGMGGCAVACGWTLGVLTIVSGRRMGQRRSRLFSIVVAAVNCASVPFGTTLGVFTLIVLSRETVKQAYAAAVPPAG